MWGFRLPRSEQVQLRCSAHHTVAVNVMVVKVDEFVRIERLHSEPVISSGAYRHGYVVTETTRLPRGNYVLVASRYDHERNGQFFVDVFSSAEAAFVAIR